MDYTKFGGLQVQLNDHVLTVVMDNPPLNAMTPQAHADLAALWPGVADDSRVRVVILTGEGDRAFSAGGDMQQMLDNWGDKARWQLGMAEARAIIVGMLECPKPIIARINGHAIGLGATLALAADITIAVDTAQIADPHVSIGLATGDGGALLWTHLVGAATARQHLFSGASLTGAKAAEIGLITRAVARDALDGTVAHWVDMLLALSPSAVQATKQALNLDLLDKAKRHMGEMLRLETRSWASPNHPEAVRAVLEKRAPRFIDE